MVGEKPLQTSCDVTTDGDGGPAFVVSFDIFLI